MPAVSYGPDVTAHEVGEQGLIDIFDVEGGALGGKVIVPNGDDAAAWFLSPQYANVVTTDSQVDGVHFDLTYTPPIAIGRKLVAVNLSDLAAMGSRPRYLLLAICVPPTMRVEVLQRIALGIQEACKLYGVAVIGGNTSTTSGPLVLTATAIGRVTPDEIVRRRGAQVGDAIYVTGHVGDAKAGLRLALEREIPMRDSPRYPLYRSLVDPQPRIEAGRRLAQHSLPNAMCDISDGFSKDLQHLLVPEGLGARIEAAALPISVALRSFAVEAGFSAEVEALAGGEDYELLFTADPADHAHVVDVCSATATPVTRVGTVTADPELEVLMSDGIVEPLPTSFEHFGRA